MISKSRDQVKSCDLSNHMTYFFSLSFDLLVTWSDWSHDFIESCDLSGHMASMSHVLFSHMLNSLLCFQTPTFGLLTNLQNMPHYIPLLLGSPIYCNTPAVSSRKVLYYINSISWKSPLIHAGTTSNVTIIVQGLVKPQKEFWPFILRRIGHSIWWWPRIWED